MIKFRKSRESHQSHQIGHAVAMLETDGRVTWIATGLTFAEAVTVAGIPDGDGRRGAIVMAGDMARLARG